MSNIKDKIMPVLFQPDRVLFGLASRGLIPMSDEAFLRLRWKLQMGTELNLDKPKTFNEKLQWLKLYDRRPEYSLMVDKYEVKEYIANRIGKEHIIPTLGVWNSFEEIDFKKLPNQFVLKCTHDSGSVVICNDKNSFNYTDAKEKLTAAMKRNFYLIGREWPYKNIKHRLIAERYMTDETGVELKDYKIFNFSGIPRLIQVDFDRFYSHKRNIYTTDWEFIDLEIEYPKDKSHVIERPKGLEEMLFMAKVLSEGIPHVRTDFYSINDQVYFGEMTFYHGSGYEHFIPEEWNERLGQWIELPKKV